jgi:uncharacterized protein YcsI (UPF0317 family)
MGRHRVDIFFCTTSRLFSCQATVMEARNIRERCRDGRHTTQTSGCAPGHAQANLVILPQKYAFDFLLFCQRNPKPCPLLEVLEPGIHTAQITAQEADIKTDLPKSALLRSLCLSTYIVLDIASFEMESSLKRSLISQPIGEMTWSPSSSDALSRLRK